MFNKKTIREWDLAGKRVLLRADYNVPLVGGKITDDYRLEQSLPTLRHILDQPGASLVIVSHLGRPKGPDDASASLRPIATRLGELLGKDVAFAADCIGEEARLKASQLPPGGVLMFENVRFHEQEEKNDEEFARAIIEASGAEVFVQDGFGVVHRAHATTDAIARQQIPAIAGLLLEKEIVTITGAMHDPDRPLVAVVGGAKIGDKIDVLNRFIEIADAVAVAGAMANDFLVASGFAVGRSLVETDSIDTAREILEKAHAAEAGRRFSFFMPVDVVVSKSKDGTAPTRVVDIASHSLADISAYPKTPQPSSYTVGSDEIILDIGPISAGYIAGAVKMAKTVIWNGTCGVTEVAGLAGAHPPFGHGTKMLVEAMIGPSNRHESKPFTVVGGGDTVGYVEAEGLLADFDHVSTGGGASLDLMSGHSLPGVEVLWEKDG